VRRPRVRSRAASLEGFPQRSGGDDGGRRLRWVGGTQVDGRRPRAKAALVRQVPRDGRTPKESLEEPCARHLAVSAASGTIQERATLAVVGARSVRRALQVRLTVPRAAGRRNLMAAAVIGAGALPVHRAVTSAHLARRPHGARQGHARYEQCQEQGDHRTSPRERRSPSPGHGVSKPYRRRWCLSTGGKSEGLIVRQLIS
jgi:hypothetical protein